MEVTGSLTPEELDAGYVIQFPDGTSAQGILNLTHGEERFFDRDLIFLKRILVRMHLSRSKTGAGHTPLATLGPRQDRRHILPRTFPPSQSPG